jgi:protein TonB
MGITIVLILAGLVLLVSLYDFFSSKSWQQVTSISRNEVVFEERNKKYGAYQIRKNYDKTIIFIIAGIILAIGVSYGAYLYVKSIPEEVVEIPFDQFQAEFEMPDEEEEIPEEIPPEEPPAPLEAQLDFREFEVTDEEVETAIVTQEELDNNKAGTQTVDDGEVTFAPPVETKPIVDVPKVDEIASFVEEDAEFPGGVTEMQKYLQKNMRYPEVAIVAGIEGKVFLKFVVEKDGKIGQVLIERSIPGCPECDAEAKRVIKNMPAWKPGKTGGKIVRSWFQMPISFTLR